MPMTESIEHVVLRILQQSGGLDVFTITNIIYKRNLQSTDSRPTKSELARVRRALTFLRNQGKIFRLGRVHVHGSNERPREVYADHRHAAAYVERLVAEIGTTALDRRADLLALAQTVQGGPPLMGAPVTA
jgi:hypothetical protein